MLFEEKIVRDMFMVLIKNMILLIIGFRGEMYGYEIFKEIEKIVWGIWKLSYGNFYIMFNKMVEEGFIEFKEEY